MNRFILFLTTLFFACHCSFAISNQTTNKIRAAINNDSRSDTDRRRDNNRLPLETLTFFGLEDDMSVIEIMPGNGWYTQILAPVLADKGKLHLYITDERIKKTIAKAKLDKVRINSSEPKQSPSGIHKWIFNLDNTVLDIEKADMALTFRNMHNFNADSRLRLNKTVFNALKPGGIYGIIDHTKRHMQPYSKATWRRTDPVEIIKEALDVGFELVAYTDLHARPSDTLQYDSKHKSVKNGSDRFTLKFRKPK